MNFTDELKVALNEVSLDRLTILAEANAELFMDWLLKSPYVAVEVPTIKHSGHFRYEIRLIDGLGHISINTDSPKVKAVRYEVNTNNFKEVGRERLKEGFEKIMSWLKHIHFSRLDIAIDINTFGFRKWKVSCSRSVKKSYFEGRYGDLETIYFGTRQSDFMYRIYDKAKQLKEVKSIELGKEMWRFELQINTSRQVEEFLSGNWNPFMDLFIEGQAVSKGRLDELSPIDELVIKGILEEPSKLNEFSRKYKEKYKKLLKTFGEKEKTSLHELYIPFAEGIKKELEALQNNSKASMNA